MPDKKDIIIIALLCVIALGLGYWVGLPEKTVDKPKAAVTPPNNATVKAVTDTNATKPIKSDDTNATKLTAEEQKVVGEYELKIDGDTYRSVLLENGIVESYKNGKKRSEAKWKISKEGELYVTSSDGFIVVYRINKDRSITVIAFISKDGKRREALKENQFTYKKIK